MSTQKQSDIYLETTKLPSWYKLNQRNLKKETPDTIYNNLFNELIHSSNTSTQIYTDAS